MLVGRDSFAVHGQAGIAVGDGLAVVLQVAEELIVGAVFLEDVEDVANRIRLAVGKGNLLAGCLHAVGVEHRFGPAGKILVDSGLIQSGERTVEKRGDVGERPHEPGSFRCLRERLGHVVGAGAFAFVSGQIELAAGEGYGDGHPFGGNKAEGLDHGLVRGSQHLRVKYGNGVAAHVGNVEAAAIGVDVQRHRLGAKVALARQACIEVALHVKLPSADVDGGHGIAVGQRDIESSPIGREREGAGMRAGGHRIGRLEEGELAAYCCRSD